MSGRTLTGLPESVSALHEQNGLARLLKVGLLASLATALMITVQVPYPGATFLSYDPSEVPALIGGFAFGPLWGLAILLLKNSLFLLFRFEPTQLIGIPMNTLAGATMVGVSTSFYQLKKTRPRALASLILGGLTMAMVMIPVNLFVLPWFTRWMTGEQLSSAGALAFVLAVITPFNLLKAGLTSTVTFLVYKRFSVFLKSEEEPAGLRLPT